MKVSFVHEALRAATAPQHQRLEVEADLEARLRDTARRGDAVAGLLQFHREADAVAAAFRPVLDAADVRPGERVAALERAVATLGGSTSNTPVADPPGDLSAVLGWLYVSEGSALGGRVMRKAMRRDGLDLTGLDFLDPPDVGVGPRWIGFLAFLEAAVADGRAIPSDVVAAAGVAFDRARAALVPLSTVSRAA
ncbi:MAG: biliverdin-producing heme oxygenase [Alphaproteobacteria bacterium]|nr:biliverdin-producing heme oxygenase [Alphaproteobacteria bacterium]MBU1524904.1 biliverdin-producing heme oxygenase [Alphaproteobacteria bacterium]MBU2116780.1 biliverdin-producing heme oxygenase [Alphaproteobacteria bacterium]MBU2352089.1 biliverdin-producing heme oxygenase [Alphaproteobacteria bacterium]MBU2381914.1 biliverdin-producing heme oxygenase [Alphaproteobacteria bacterium]